MDNLINYNPENITFIISDVECKNADGSDIKKMTFTTSENTKFSDFFMPKRIYISGKISGLPIGQAKAKFKFAAEAVTNDGNIALNPFDNKLDDSSSWEEHMKADLTIMLTCDEVYLLPCWSESKGAVIERDLAKRLGIPVHYVQN